MAHTYVSAEWGEDALECVQESPQAPIKKTHEAAIRRREMGERHMNLIDEKGEKVTILVGGVTPMTG